MEGRASGTRGAQRAARYIGGEMNKIGLEPLGDSGYFQRVDMSNSAQVPAAIRALPAVNVLGVIRGSDPVLKNEYVLVDAHYDHLGIGRAVNGDSIYNGADDDASGVTAVLEIARQIISGPKPKRTVVFATMMGEEVGLIGNDWYIAH